MKTHGGWGKSWESWGRGGSAKLRLCRELYAEEAKQSGDTIGSSKEGETGVGKFFKTVMKRTKNPSSMVHEKKGKNSASEQPVFPGKSLN